MSALPLGRRRTPSGPAAAAARHGTRKRLAGRPCRRAGWKPAPTDL